MILVSILKESLNKGASDIIVTSGIKPCLKINGDVEYLEEYDVYEKEDLKKELFGIMKEAQVQQFEKNKELDFSIDLKGYSRFRVNVFYSKKGIGAVFRIIREDLPVFKDLGLSNQILRFINKKNGLILVTGGVGSGKSTTLAALIDIINTDFNKHIITVEDPIEFSFESKKSIIQQREVGKDTLSFDNGLKYALRQASDVIMVGEMRDIETFRLALRAAETGNLVFATLHTSGAARTISRIIDMFPGDEKNQIKSQLATSLVGLVWQDLLKTKDGKGRVVAEEILVNTPTVQNMIRKGLTHQIKSAIETGAEDGMVTMEESLNKLRKKGLIK